MCIRDRGKNSMGQLRSAVVPYSLSILFTITDGDKKSPSFDLLKIWLNEGLESDLDSYLTRLLRLVNRLIKKYSDSDDYGEFSKKEELWNRIKNSTEVVEFVNDDGTIAIISKYGISKAKLKKRKGAADSLELVEFKNLSDNSLIHSNGLNYYKSIQEKKALLSELENRKLSLIVNAIIHKTDIDSDLVKIENSITNKLRIQSPTFFDKVERGNDLLYSALTYIIKNYNTCINKKRNILSEFHKIDQTLKAKNIKNSFVFSQIGKSLSKGVTPTIKQIYSVSKILNSEEDTKTNLRDDIIDVAQEKITEVLMRKMFEWDSSAIVLSAKERNCLLYTSPSPRDRTRSRMPSSA